jgi:undecaprenyl-diphosphatase
VAADEAARMTTAGENRRWWMRLRRNEVEWLVLGLGACILLFAFVILAGKVMGGDTQALDVRILKALRDRADASTPVGPAWLESAMIDLTAIGGSTILWLVVLAVAGFLVLQTRYRTALVILGTTGSGELLNAIMKHAFNRPRPTIVTHLRVVSSSSFPSGHARESAIVYLTLGVILMRASDRTATKIYVFAVAVTLTLLAGVSRLYLGVHYPTDIVGGWIVGFSWASICWLAAKRFDGTTHVQGEKSKSP